MKCFKKSSRLAHWEEEYKITKMVLAQIAWKALAEPNMLNNALLHVASHELKCIKSVIRRINKL